MQILKNVKQKFSQIYPTKIAFTIPPNIYIYIYIYISFIIIRVIMFDFGFSIFKHSILVLQKFKI